jgi:transposase
MSYSEDYRRRVIEYRNEGHTLEETGEVFDIAASTICRWNRQLKEEGTLRKRAGKRPFKKIDPEKLVAYIQANPDAYLREIAVEFHCCKAAVSKALKRLKITRKKRRNITGNKTLKR